MDIEPFLNLDQAATSFPKPEEVCRAVEEYHRFYGVGVGRGAYRAAMKVGRIVENCRRRVAELLGAESPERILFTFNGTDSLNLVLHGLLQPGDHVVTSTLEHNSVLRPLADLAARFDVRAEFVAPRDGSVVNSADFREKIRPGTRAVILTHASNVTGAIQPIAEIGDLARRAGAVMIVDAAQTAGHLPIDLRNLPVDILAAPGHKGLLGPLGSGIVYLRSGLEEQVRSTRQGGTGTSSEEERQPDTLPQKYESGNHNAPALVGLDAALQWLLQQGIERIRQHEIDLTRQLLEGLSSMPGVRLFGPRRAEDKVGVTSFAIEGLEPVDVAAILDDSFNIAVRSGLHCAPGAHRALGTLEAGGTVRLSTGPFHRSEQIEQVLDALRKITGG